MSTYTIYVCESKELQYNYMEPTISLFGTNLASLMLSDPSRFRFAHQTSFVRRHSGLSTMPGVRYIVRPSLLYSQLQNVKNIYPHIV